MNLRFNPQEADSDRIPAHHDPCNPGISRTSRNRQRTLANGRLRVNYRLEARIHGARLGSPLSSEYVMYSIPWLQTARCMLPYSHFGVLDHRGIQTKYLIPSPLPPNLGLDSGVRRSLNLSVEGDLASSRGRSARACHNGVSVDHNAMGNVDDLPRCE